jgi:hypothetical protein
MEQGKKSSTMAAAIPIPSNFGNVSNPVPADFLASPTSSPYTSPSTSPVVSSSFGSFTGASPFSMSPPLLSNPPAHFGNGLGLGVGQGLEGSNPALWYPCVVCTQRFQTPQPLLEHMGIFHHLIISDLHQIAELHTYVRPPLRSRHQSPHDFFQIFQFTSDRGDLHLINLCTLLLRV